MSTSFRTIVDQQAHRICRISGWMMAGWLVSSGSAGLGQTPKLDNEKYFNLKLDGRI